MQRLYDDDDSTDVLGRDSPFAPHDIDLIIAVFTLASETRVLTQPVDYARIPLGCAPCTNAPHLRCR